MGVTSSSKAEVLYEGVGGSVIKKLAVRFSPVFYENKNIRYKVATLDQDCGGVRVQ